jgi:hypothetical protein
MTNTRSAADDARAFDVQIRAAAAAAAITWHVQLLHVAGHMRGGCNYSTGFGSKLNTKLRSSRHLKVPGISLSDSETSRVVRHE